MNKILNSVFIFVLTSVNVILGMLLGTMMMGGDFFGVFLGSQPADQIAEFDQFFLDYVLHPGTGILYISAVIGVAVCQFKTNVLRHRYILNGVMIGLSGLILLKLVSMAPE
ncbi:hypothetical protein ACFL2V_04170 [Pseudomonadota bacterium]